MIHLKTMKDVNLSAPFSWKVGQRCFCNTSRFLMILSFGIWPLCLHKQDQAFGIKRPLRQCPGRIWSHNLPVQVPASCKHCKYLQYNAMEIQHFSHSVSWYQYIILYHCISSISSDTFWHLQHPWQWPLGTMKGPRKPATCMMLGLLHKCTSCDIANSAENCWRFSLSLLSRSTCNVASLALQKLDCDEYKMKLSTHPCLHTFKHLSNIIKSCTNWLWSKVSNSAFLDVATPSWSIQEGNQGCSWKAHAKNGGHIRKRNLCNEG